MVAVVWAGYFVECGVPGVLVGYLCEAFECGADVEACVLACCGYDVAVEEVLSGCGVDEYACLVVGYCPQACGGVGCGGVGAVGCGAEPEVEWCG